VLSSIDNMANFRARCPKHVRTLEKALRWLTVGLATLHECGGRPDLNVNFPQGKVTIKGEPSRRPTPHPIWPRTLCESECKSFCTDFVIRAKIMNLTGLTPNRFTCSQTWSDFPYFRHTSVWPCAF
jgi:hypothetical protein